MCQVLIYALSTVVIKHKGLTRQEFQTTTFALLKTVNSGLWKQILAFYQRNGLWWFSNNLAMDLTS